MTKRLDAFGPIRRQRLMWLVCVMCVAGVQVPRVRTGGRHMALHSSIANVNPGQMLRVWRNATDGFAYVSLPGGLLPGPYRVLRRGRRHVTDSHPVSACRPSRAQHPRAIPPVAESRTSRRSAKCPMTATLSCTGQPCAFPGTEISCCSALVPAAAAAAATFAALAKPVWYAADCDHSFFKALTVVDHEAAARANCVMVADPRLCCQLQVSDVRVYEVDGLLVPRDVALGLLYAPRPYGVKQLAPILRKLAAQGPAGWHLRN